MRKFRELWAAMWHRKADDLRAGWDDFTAQWEADTRPGYPLTGVTASRRDLGLALADLYDAIGGKRS